MRKLFRYLVFVAYELAVVLALMSALFWGSSFVVEYRGASPWPTWLATPTGVSADGTYLRIDINDGRLAASHIRPMPPDEALGQRLNPFPPGGYQALNFGIVPTDGVWFPLGASTLWLVSVQSLWWAVSLCGVALVLWLLRRICRQWMTIKQRSLVCLHCGKTFDTDAGVCDRCGAARPLVTVSSRG